MNPLIVFLLIIIILVVFVLIYKTIFPPNTALNKVTNLANSPTTVLITDGKSTYGNVSYAVWVYVNSWNSSKKVIFSRSGDLALYLDETSPSLFCDISITPLATDPKDGSYNASKLLNCPASQTITITKNFPIQKWVYVIISMDSTGFSDIYLDGKLVKSVKLMNFRPTLPGPPGTDQPIVIGSAAPFDAYVSQFIRYVYTMDPQTAWNLYLYGNNSNSLFSQYHVDISLSKNGIVQKDIALL